MFLSLTVVTIHLTIIIILISYVENVSVVYSMPKIISDNNNLKIGLVYESNIIPSNMEIIDKNKILLLDRDNGKINLINNGKFVKTILDVNVATIGYRGLLGIAYMKLDTNFGYLFVYYTESSSNDGDDEKKGYEPFGNRIYRYEYHNGELKNPKLLLDLPTSPGPRHMGGEIAIGPDKNLYISVGDLDGTSEKKFHTMTQNSNDSNIVDGRSGILVITSEGKMTNKTILGISYPLNLYYAYGIRNSFGMDWDPLTEKLWDTENGPTFGDEINLLETGFNSGWSQVQGIWVPDSKKHYEEIERIFNSTEALIDFNGIGKYSSPEFIWTFPVAPTALKFFDSKKFGPEFENDLFVSDANTGSIYHFDLNQNRTHLQLDGKLSDKIADNFKELESNIFASGFSRITDMQIGLDGYMYVLSTDNKKTWIYKIYGDD